MSNKFGFKLPSCISVKRNPAKRLFIVDPKTISDENKKPAALPADSKKGTFSREATTLSMPVNSTIGRAMASQKIVISNSNKHYDSPVRQDTFIVEEIEEEYEVDIDDTKPALLNFIGEQHKPTYSMFSCPTCNKCGAELDDLHSFSLRIEGHDSRFLCIKCSELIERKYLYKDEGITFMDRKKNTKGQKTQHLEIKIADSYDGGVNDELDEPLTDVYQCRTCNKTFDDDESLELHIVLEHNPKIKCRGCDEEFTVYEDRNHHEASEHYDADNKLWHCHICGKTFKDIMVLNGHMYDHAGKISSVCYICGKGFLRPTALRNHLLNHSQDKRHKCHLCSKTFKLKHQLKVHLRRHTGIRPFKCDQCDNAYKEQTDLRRHKFTHGGFEKKFACTLCDKKFYEHKSLRYHQKTHRTAA